MINEGYLNSSSLTSLAERLGVGVRYLRKLFEQQVGVAPSVIAQTQRLHLAQKLLLETAMPVTDIAFSSGFGSVRRFNSATLQNFGCSPGQLRRRRLPASAEPGITLELAYRPPYDWPGVFDFFSRHSVSSLEQAADNYYRRNLRTERGVAQIRVWPHPRKQALNLHLRMSDTSELMSIVATVRRMFDLDAQPEEIRESLQQDPMLKPLLDQTPGIRSPVVASVFESCVRGVLGQQISIEAARRLNEKLRLACDSQLDLDGLPVAVFPTPQQLAALPDSEFPMPGTRRNTLRAICQYFADNPADSAAQVLADLAAVKGIGPWTTTMLAMRGFGDPDCFPLSDLGLIKAADNLAGLGKKELCSKTELWKPWRSYAANLLWRTLSK
jgi:AraC family transcriptional regulator of adaptative response / DNA-3-methyladenine glycosylase II